MEKPAAHDEPFIKMVKQSHKPQVVTEPGEGQGSADPCPEGHGLLLQAGPLSLVPVLAIRLF